MSPSDLLPGPRVLLGPGPSMADPRVLRAMSTPLLGQFDPEFTAIMNEVVELTRFAFQTGAARAFPVPGTGRAGLEAALTSLIEPGDRAIVAECGRFGLLLIEIAERCGAEVSAVRSDWGPLVGITRLAHDHGALVVADCVVTLGGCDVGVDRWDVDVAIAGTQKCLSCPSGLAPIAYNARADAVIRGRRTKVASNYLDLGQLADYWSP